MVEKTLRPLREMFHATGAMKAQHSLRLFITSPALGMEIRNTS
jgi:hypothetical protein